MNEEMLISIVDANRVLRYSVEREVQRDRGLFFSGQNYVAPQLAELYERLDNVELLYIPLQDTNVGGLFLRLDSFSVVIINSALSLGNVNHKLIHEFCHIKHPETLTSDFEIIKDYSNYLLEPNERFANLYASSMLMEEKTFLDMWESYGKDNLEEFVARAMDKFEVTYKSIIIRLHTLEKIDDYETSITMMERFSNQADEIFTHYGVYKSVLAPVMVNSAELFLKQLEEEFSEVEHFEDAKNLTINKIKDMLEELAYDTKSNHTPE